MPLAETQTQLTAPEQREEKGMLKPPDSLRSAITISKAEGKILPSALKTISLTTQWQQ